MLRHLAMTVLGCAVLAAPARAAVEPTVDAYGPGGEPLIVPFKDGLGGTYAVHSGAVGKLRWQYFPGPDAGPTVTTVFLDFGDCFPQEPNPLTNAPDGVCWSRSFDVLNSAPGTYMIAVPPVLNAGTDSELVFDHWASPGLVTNRCRTGDMGIGAAGWPEYRVWMDLTTGEGTDGRIQAHYVQPAPDITGPIVTLRSPSDCAVVKQGAEIEADYDCIDPHLASCQGSRSDGALIDTDTTGLKTFGVLGQDATGNSRGQEVSYLVDGAAPVITMESDPASPSDPDNEVFNAQELGVGGKLPVTVGATDEVGGSGLSSISCTLDGAPVTSALPGTIELGEGPHALACTATDRAGWVTQESGDWTVDTIAPTTHFEPFQCPPPTQILLPNVLTHLDWTSDGEPASGSVLLDQSPGQHVATSGPATDIGLNPSIDESCPYRINTTPAAADDAYQTASGTPLTVPATTGVLANDTDPDPHSREAAVAAAPQHASDFALLPDGSFAYTPAPGFSGEDTFTYRVTDFLGAQSALATVKITVKPAASVAETPTPTATPAVTATPPITTPPVAGPPTPAKPDFTAAFTAVLKSLTGSAGKLDPAKPVLALGSFAAGLCPNGCTLSALVKTGKTTLAKQTLTVAKGQSPKLTLRLNAAAKRLLRRKRSVKATITLTIRDALTGATQSTARPLTLKARRR